MHDLRHQYADQADQHEHRRQDRADQGNRPDPACPQRMPPAFGKGREIRPQPLVGRFQHSREQHAEQQRAQHMQQSAQHREHLLSVQQHRRQTEQHRAAPDEDPEQRLFEQLLLLLHDNASFFRQSGC